MRVKKEIVDIGGKTFWAAKLSGLQNFLGCRGGGEVVGCTFRGGHRYPFAGKR